MVEMYTIVRLIKMTNDTNTIEARVESWTIRDEDGNAYTNPFTIRIGRGGWYKAVYGGYAKKDLKGE